MKIICGSQSQLFSMYSIENIDQIHNKKIQVLSSYVLHKNLSNKLYCMGEGVSKTPSEEITVLALCPLFFFTAEVFTQYQQSNLGR